MKLNFKRLSLALILLGMATPVLADTCSPFDVTVPNQQGGFTFGADALLMRATAPNLGYSALFGIPVASGSTITDSGTLSDISTTYQWGFDVMAGYRIPGTGNDVTLSWTHLGNFNDSDSASSPFEVFTGDVVTGHGVLIINGNIEDDYDAVDLDLGQRVNFGDYFNFRMFAGARWADVKQDIDNNSNANSTSFLPVNPLVSAYSNDSDFKGVGPQIGFDGRYCLGYGFGIDGNVTASMLVGDVDTDASAFVGPFGTGPVADSFTTTNLDNNSRDRVVPALDASLGLDYTYAFANCDRSYLTVQAGYRVINYFDVTQSALADSTAAAPGVPAYTLGNESHSISFDGGYAGIKVNL